MIKKILFLILLFAINNCFAVDYPKALIVEHAGDTYAGDYTSPDGDFAPAKERHKEGYTGTYIYEGMINGFPYWVQNGCIGEFVIKECRCYIYKQDGRWVLVPQAPNTSGKLYGRTDDWLANAYTDNEWPWEGKWAGNVKSITINNDIDLTEARKKAKINSCPSNDRKPEIANQEQITNQEQIAKNLQFVEEQINMDGTYLREFDTENPAKPDNSVNRLSEQLTAYLDENGESYQGEIKNGLPHGIGVSTSQQQGRKYIGGWKNGVPNGFGIMSTQNELYIGEFKNSMRHGKGQIFKVDGWPNMEKNKNFMDENSEKYIFNIDVFNVKENINEFVKYLINADLRRFEGNFKDDVKHGNGRAWYKNGSMYSGNFSEDQPNGKGQKSFADGDFYNGDFKQGIFHGKGSLISTDGSQYVGQFVNGIANGRGTKTFNDKTSYTGNFKNGVADGKGTFRKRNGEKISGTWKNGKIIKRN